MNSRIGEGCGLTSGKSSLEKTISPFTIALMKPFEEIVKFIADAAGVEKLSAFKPSEAAEKRVAELLAKQQSGSLRPKEHKELQLFVQLDHVMSLAQAKAQARGRRASAA